MSRQVIRRSSLSDFTRGGQTTLHFIRMVSQVIKKFGAFLIFCVLLCWLGYVYLNTTPYEQQSTLRWAMAKLSTDHLQTGHLPMNFPLPDGRTLRLSKKTVANDAGVKALVGHVKQVILQGGRYASLMVGGFFILLVMIIYRTGFALRQETTVRGRALLTGEQLTQQLKQQKKAGDFTVGNVRLPNNAEVKHLLFTGSHGAGKSVGLKAMLATVRKKKQRAIVFSTSSEFIEAFYREGQDVILNPLDQRCPRWDIWCEAKSPSDFDNIAASLIPEPTGGQDPFWALAARTLFSTVSMTLYKNNQYSTPKLLRDLLTINLEEAAKLVKGTEGAALIAQGAEKTALSVRSTLATYIRSLKFLKHEGERFSIRDWVLDEAGDGWIFITANAEQLETLRPLITTWLDIACSSVLSLPEDSSRRVWLTIDELPALNKLPRLEHYLAQARKYGGCALLGFQSIAQLRSRYGRDVTESLLGLCGAWFIYRANEPAMAELAAKKLGDVEVMTPSEGISYGANDIRDGVSLSMQRQRRPLVLPTEIMGLADLQGYACLGSGAPNATFTLRYKKYPKMAPGFLPGDIAATSWDFSASKDEADDTIHDDLFRTLN